MNWKTYYETHLTTAEEAVTHIKSGDRVVVAHACGEPSYLLDAMVANASAYRDVELVHMVAMGKGDYCKPEYAENFRHNAIFVGGSSREAVADGRADFTPSFFFEVPRLFSTTMPVDVALVMVTPPDENGMCSLGVSVDYTQEAVKQAKLVIAQINPQMPWTGPNSLVSVKDLDVIVEHDAPLIELKPGKIGEIEKAIGEHCASLVPDGATLQLGIGAIPDAVLLFLKDKKDLGIHSEMFSDGVVELAEAGVITNAKKSLNPGKFVVAFLMGTKRLYDFVNHNPDVDMRPVDYVNHPFVVAQNDNLISINSCVQVDLMGQVASETVG
ncbi:MAG: acetyl-CoA hydrolase/transferase family protein, partial [Flavonifractor sp.]|nr:acetyl-CoA hydrolase/transferase family protein [Flavonifractor sp.]